MGKFKEPRKILPQKNDYKFEGDNDDWGKDPVIKWYENAPEDPEDFKPLSGAIVNQLRDEARVVLENEALHYKNKRLLGNNRSQNNWLETMMTKGTSHDRLAASIVALQNSPLHGLGILKHLINEVRASKKHCTKAMELVTDLFLSDLLIPERKLKPFEERPLSLLENLSEGNGKKRRYFLSLWYFEDQLKNEYRKFLEAVKDVGRDTVIVNREKSIISMQKLLTANPEQEAFLLTCLVNKMGDTVPSVASKATYNLKKVLTEHPNMKTVVMEEIEKLVFRPNVNPRAQYYGICFLSEYIFRNEEEKLADRLIHIYFSFFKACVKKGDVDSRMMKALLAGVNRAYPYAQKDTLNLREHIDTMYRIVHLSQFGVSLHALSLLLQVSSFDATISDRFYSALFRQILHPDLLVSSHQTMFISLVFRAMYKDIQFSRVKVFIKRLLQICHYGPVTLACGILLMISHMFKKFPHLHSMVLTATEFKEEGEQSDEEHYVDAKLEEIEEEENETSLNNKEKTEVQNENVDEGFEEKKPVVPSWYHLNVNRKNNSKTCHAFVRNPLFLTSEFCVYTELVSLAVHFHPTVSLFANHLLEGKDIEYSGDPFSDFTLIRFLDRWVFKNPKTINKENETRLARKKLTSSSLKNLAVNSEEYLHAPESSVPTDEMFMYKFFKKQQLEGKKTKHVDDDDDVSSVASDEFESMMDRLMGGQKEINFADGINTLSSKTKDQQKRKGELDSSEDDLEDELDESDLSDAENYNLSDGGDGSGEDDEDELIDYDTIKEEFSDLDELDDDKGAITFGGDSDDDFSFTMSDVERDELEHKQKKKSKLISKGQKIKKGLDSVFAPAEEFAHMLENTGDQFAKYGSIANVSNKDNAGMKQLKWEMNRNNWIPQHQGKRKKYGQNTNKNNKKFKNNNYKKNKFH